MIYAQSDFDLSQRWFNEAVYNPAATGNSFTTSVFLQYRKQWVNLDGAPSTGIVSADMYLADIRSAVGFSIANDKIGLMNTYNARAAYAYYISLGDRSALSLGLSASLLHRNRNTNNAIIIDPYDPRVSANNISQYSPDFDFGIEYQGLFKLGVVARHLLDVKSKENSESPVYSRNFWAYASTRFNVLYHMSVEPSVSYTFRDKINRYEGGMLFYFLRSNSERTYNDKFWIGAMYRFNDQFSVLVGAQISSRLRLGYSYDHGLRSLGNLSNKGTHEIFLAWQFNRIFYKDPSMDCPAYKSRSYSRSVKKKKVDLYEQFN